MAKEHLALACAFYESCLTSNDTFFRGPRLHQFIPFFVTWGVHNYDLDLLAADISAVVGALGHRSATLVAHDWVSGILSSHQSVKHAINQTERTFDRAGRSIRSLMPSKKNTKKRLYKLQDHCILTQLHQFMLSDALALAPDFTFNEFGRLLRI
eukprot:975409-Pelagomonas_calceolata.AAC.2